MKGGNKPSRTRLLVLLLLIGVFAAVIQLELGKQLGAWLRAQDGDLTEGFQLPINPELDAQARAAVPPSAWNESEKKRYTAILAQAKPDVIVLPYQIPTGKDQYGIDLSARMVMAHMTAQRVALEGELKVADVELAALATGEPRHMSRDEAVAFARSVGAATVVYGTAAHDGKGRLAVSVVRASTVEDRQDRSENAERIDISDTKTPELAFRDVVDRLMRGIGFSASPQARRHTVADGFFPEDPANLPALAADNPVAGLWTQQLLGSLHFADPDSGKARAYERVLAALEFVDPDSPDYRVIAARALVQLERRPAALAIIGAPRTPEEAAMVEFLNGNAPDLAAAIEKIKRPLPKLLARLELGQLAVAYVFESGEVSAMAEEAASEAPPAWQPAIVWSMSLRNRWLQRSTVEMKQVLDVQFPIEGYSLEDLLRGKSIAGYADNPRLAWELEGAAVQHVRRLVEQQGGGWCCATAAWQPRPFQYPHLISSLSVAMLLHVVAHVERVQGQPERALAMAEALADTVLQGAHPKLQHHMLSILSDLMYRERAPEKRAALANRLYDTARQVRLWSTSDTGAVLSAIHHEKSAAAVRFADRGGSAGYPELNHFAADFPQAHFAMRASREYQAALELGGDIDVIRRACAYSVYAMPACFAWRAALDATGRTSEARQVEQELTRRFRGNEYMATRNLAVYRNAGRLDEARAYAERAIAVNPRRSRLYVDLGALHLRSGDVEAARKVFMSYPVFNEPQKNTVTLTGHANWVASAFAYRGALKEARHFYELAARHPNGAESHYSSVIALAYMDRRYGDALDVALRSAQHYPGGGSAYRYIALLFATGDSRSGWAAAREAVSRYPGSTAWHALPVAFRMEQTDAKAIGAWAVEAAQLPDHSGNGPESGPVNALTIAMQALTLDRPADSFASLQAIRDQILPKRPARVFTAESARSNRHQGSRLDYMDRFIVGYTAHKRGDFEAAWHAFENLPMPGAYYQSTDAFLTSMPYHAYAAARTGRGKAFLAYLEQFEKPLKITPLDQPPVYLTQFDISLARAALASAAGDRAEAKKQLLLARSYNQVISARLSFPAYVLAEMCELLAGDDARRESLDIGVSVAQANQVTEPWSAWSYAYEALHGTNAAERAKAYAIARYLDPQSERLSRVPPEIAKKADEWLKFDKPFPHERSIDLKKAL